ncbi:MAG: ornithine carbamoyltransferase [Candidatus Bathyarchaeia archaeon]
MSLKNLKGRDLLNLQEFKPWELEGLLKLASEFKRGLLHRSGLTGKVIGLIFEKPSTRTRVSIEVAVNKLGGSSIYMAGEDLQLGRREPIEDTARVLDRYLDCIVARVYSHNVLVKLAEYSSIPVINALSDLSHPLQALADLLTIWERTGNLKGVKIAYIGDGNNVCNSLLIGCSKLGASLTVACPEGYEPNHEFLEWAKCNASQSGSEIKVLRNPIEAVKGADFIYTDVFVSMGFESEREIRLKKFLPKYSVTSELLQSAGKQAYLMHPLPCHRGEEVEASAIEGPHSIVWDQAENRLYTAEAVLATLV